MACWQDLSFDVKRRIWAFLRLDEMLHVVQVAMPSHDIQLDISIRICSLQPLHAAWIMSPMEMRNVPRYRTPESRRRVNPTEFVTLERLIIGHSNMSGMLTPAIAELASCLKVLHCDQNQLSDLPESLVLCTKLRVLDASENMFRSVPPCVLALPTLRVLSFSQNRLLGPTLPHNLIHKLPYLIRLGFYGCALVELPASLISFIADTSDTFFANVSYNPFPSGMWCLAI
jgi:hypothetical protein